MKRTHRTDETIGSDSFLDVVTNIVGILIILVMVAGIRVGQSKIRSAPVDEDPTKTAAELASLAAEAAGLEGQARKLADQTMAVNQELLVRGRVRATLAYLVVEHERELSENRHQLDQQSQELFDLRRALATAKAELDNARQGMAQAAARDQRTIIEVKSYPTPISQTVLGNEAHCQLRGGRVVFIPLDELVDLLKEQARQKMYKLRDLSQITETVGPIDGFRMRYSLERLDLPIETQLESGRASLVRLFEYTLVPMSDQLGEPLETALAPRSQFRSILGGLNPRRHTITVWTYPDSFAEFRQLKEDLYRLGFSVAGRPLPDGYPISGSPLGAHSAAQ